MVRCGWVTAEGAGHEWHNRFGIWFCRQLYNLVCKWKFAKVVCPCKLKCVIRVLLLRLCGSV